MAQAVPACDYNKGESQYSMISQLELVIRRRRLPHWRLEGSVYFVTWRLKPGQSLLTDAERDLVETTVKFHHPTKYRLYAYVVMDDHVHLLLSPAENGILSRIIGQMKAYASRMLVKQFSRHAPVWQDEFFDRIVRNEAEFKQKGEYILTNPQRRWPDLTDYRWVGYLD